MFQHFKIIFLVFCGMGSFIFCKSSSYKLLKSQCVAVNVVNEVSLSKRRTIKFATAIDTCILRSFKLYAGCLSVLTFS